MGPVSWARGHSHSRVAMTLGFAKKYITWGELEPQAKASVASLEHPHLTQGPWAHSCGWAQRSHQGNSLLAPTTCWGTPMQRPCSAWQGEWMFLMEGGLLHRNRILLAIEIRAGLGCSPKVQEIPSSVQNRQSKRQRALAQCFTTELLLAPALMWHNVQWQALNNSRIDSTFFLFHYFFPYCRMFIKIITDKETADLGVLCLGGHVAHVAAANPACTKERVPQVPTSLLER